MTQTRHQNLIVETHQGVCSLTLNRPEVRNAFDDFLIEALIEGLDNAASQPDLRLLVLQSEGKHFSAGADLNWMRAMANYSVEQNVKDALKLAELMRKLHEFPCPTLVKVQGASFGGAVGLCACADIVIASFDAKFCFSEVKIGLIPAVISPYVIAAIGARQANRYFLTAEVFDAQTAQTLGLVHEIAEDLNLCAKILIDQIKTCGPKAQRQAKTLVHENIKQTHRDALIEYTAKAIADIRVSSEGQEGLTAFLNKRKANWIET